MYEKYGDVTTLYLGNELCILLSGYKSFKEAFVEQADVFTDRAHYPLNDKLSRGMGKDAQFMWNCSFTESNISKIFTIYYFHYL